MAADVAVARADLLRRIGDLPGLRAWPSAANFLLLHAPGRGQAVIGRLTSAGIVVRPAHTFPGLDGDYLRVAVRTPQAHARLADALASALCAEGT